MNESKKRKNGSARVVEVPSVADAETVRLEEDALRARNWKRWGPYLSERQWGTVREDYSENGTAWDYFPHDHARSRAYRWGEDGLLGIADRQGRACFALALWNGKDPILKERLFGLSSSEGNHGEDVKECYYYLDSTPTHSYMRALYKYPQAEFPYDRLVAENKRRGKDQPEFELIDTGVFDDDRYFDVFVEYAKASPADVLARVTVANRGPEAARIHVLPTLWYRNTWSWGRVGEEYTDKPLLERIGDGQVRARHPQLAEAMLYAGPAPSGGAPELLFTENETNMQRLFNAPNASPYVKDAFHAYVVNGRADAVNPEGKGTKAAAHYAFEVGAGKEVVIKLRVRSVKEPRTASPLGAEFDKIFDARKREADAFFDDRLPAELKDEERLVAHQAYAGLLWSKQFYHYVVPQWIEGDPACPKPPARRKKGRNHDWIHLYNRDVISMPDKWEYPWYAAWDLAFHMFAFARVDPHFAKQQLTLFLREWYMHPNGQIPAYEWALADVNPPVHAWACWRVYKKSGARGRRDRQFLASAFQKLLVNFTWWVNRKDVDGNNVFSGGFLGLDNIGVFDRSAPLPTGGHLEQADGTAWMAFYSATMLSIAMELASEDPAYDGIASKFFEHFVAIVDAMNGMGTAGLWDEQDGFYYDQVHVDGQSMPLRTRSMVGLLPLIAVEVLDDSTIEKLPGFKKRMDWYLENRHDITEAVCFFDRTKGTHECKRLLAIPSRDRLVRVLRYMLDESEFLSPYGIRSLSKVHEKHPFVLHIDGTEHRVDYAPGESTTGLFGGNSNWRGPIWFPVNALLLEALERYHHFYGDSLRVECPTGSGKLMNLQEVALEIAERLSRIFLPDADGARPCHGSDPRYASDPHWRDLVLFHEYFHADTGRGVGASHQTGWTALVATLMEAIAQRGDAIRKHAAATRRARAARGA